MDTVELNRRVAAQVAQRIFSDKNMTREDAVAVLEFLKETCEEYIDVLKEDIKNAS